MPFGSPHIRRTRLLRLLATAESPVILITAPAGWGKTSLLDQWGASVEGPLVRLQLEPHHAADARLLGALADACAVALGEPRTEWRDRAAADGRPASELARVLLARLPANTWVILDDGHAVPDGQPADALLGTLVGLAVAGGFRLLLAGRTEPGWVAARHKVYGAARCLTAADLALDAAEVRAFFADTHVSSDEAFLAEAARRTEGWAVGLRILRHAIASTGGMGSAHSAAMGPRISAGRSAGDTFPAANADTTALGDYFDQEILAPLSEADREALGDLAFLGSIDQAGCDALGLASAWKRVCQLAESGLFVSTAGDSLRLHPMLRDHLRQRARAGSPARTAAFLLRLADWHGAAGRHDAALDNAFEAASLDAACSPHAATLLEDAVPDLIMSAQRQRVLSLATMLPVAALRPRPFLQRLLAWLASTEDPVTEVSADAPRAADAECMKHVLRAAAALHAADPLALAHAARAAEAALPEANVFLRNVVVSILQAAFRFSGDPAAGSAALEHAARLAEQVRHPAAAVQAGAMNGILLLMHGRLFAAEEALARALRLADAKLDEGAPARALAHQFMGYVLYEWDELDKAATHLERAARIARPVAHRPILTGTLRVLAHVRLGQGQTAAAAELLDELNALMSGPETTVRNREWLDGVQAAYAVASADPVWLTGWTARRGYTSATIAASPAFEVHARLQEYSTFAQALLVLRRAGEAEEAARAISGTAGASGRRGFEASALAMVAAAREARGDARGADAALAEALEIAAPERMVRTIAETPAPLDAVLARARPNGVPIAFLEAVRRANGYSASPAGLTDRERRVLELLAGGRSNKALARELDVSVSTVKTHLHNAFRKLGATSRTHALARARALGVIAGEPPARPASTI